MALPEKHELLPDLLYLFVLGPCLGGHLSEADAPVVTTPERLRSETHPRRAQETTVSLLSSDAAFERQVVIGFHRSGSVIQEW